MEAERPGIEPNTIPIATPATMKRRDLGEQTAIRAAPSCANAPIYYLLILKAGVFLPEERS